jgi:serine/threonine protein phosphatase PrpC
VICHRVEGRLAMSRAVGDLELKNEPTLDQIEQKVTAEPDITHAKLQKGDFVLVACDGIFETCGTSDIISIIYEELSQLDPEDSLTEVTENLLDECLQRGSHDNMTAILVVATDSVETIIDEPRLSKNRFKPLEGVKTVTLNF